MEIKYEILDTDRLERLSRLKRFNRYGYLAGGTALALQIGHRYSYDFDLFLKKSIGNTLLKLIKTNFSIKKILVNTPDEFSFLDDKNIKFTFLYYPFIFPDKLIKTKEGVKLLSIKNIAASKAYTIGRRGSYRDYVDLYWLLRDGFIDLSNLLQRCNIVFDGLFSGKMFLAQLNYFGDITKEDIKSVEFLSGGAKYKDIKDFFEQLVKKYLKLL